MILNIFKGAGRANHNYNTNEYLIGTREEQRDASCGIKKFVTCCQIAYLGHSPLPRGQNMFNAALTFRTRHSTRTDKLIKIIIITIILEPGAGDHVYFWFLFLFVRTLEALCWVAFPSVDVQVGMPFFRRRAQCLQTLWKVKRRKMETCFIYWKWFPAVDGKNQSCEHLYNVELNECFDPHARTHLPEVSLCCY